MFSLIPKRTFFTTLPSQRIEDFTLIRSDQPEDKLKAKINQISNFSERLIHKLGEPGVMISHTLRGEMGLVIQPIPRKTWLEFLDKLEQENAFTHRDGEYFMVNEHFLERLVKELKELKNKE